MTLYEFPMTYWIQCMDSTNAFCYWRCLKQHQVAHAAISDKFARRDRLAVTDGDSSIAVVERSYKTKEKIASLHIICEVHGAAGIMAKTVKPIDDLVSLLIAMILSLNFVLYPGALLHP